MFIGLPTSPVQVSGSFFTLSHTDAVASDRDVKFRLVFALRGMAEYIKEIYVKPGL